MPSVPFRESGEAFAMRPWVSCPSYDIDLDAPLSRRFEVMDGEMLARARGLLGEIRAEAPSWAAALGRLVDLRTGFRFHREARAAARVGGIDWKWLMVANASYDLAMAHMACSTVALATPDGPVVARNMDWWPEDKLAAASCLLRFVRGGRLAWAVAGWPGSIGAVTGLSGRGFAVVLHAVLSKEKCRRRGYPVLLFLRRLLEDAADFDQAVAMLSRQKLFMSGLFTLVGTANHQRVCVERTPTRAKLRWGRGDEPLVTTNHYVAFPDAAQADQSDEVEELLASTPSRYDNLLRLARALPPGARGDSTALLCALSDEGVIQDITAQHVILQPAAGRIELYVPRRLLGPSAGLT